MKFNISSMKGYMPAVGFLAAFYAVYSTKAAGFGQAWTDIQYLVSNPSAALTKIKNNLTYVIAAIIIFIMTPILARKVSNQYVKAMVSLIGNYAGSYLILKYIIDPPEMDRRIVISGSPGGQNRMWSNSTNAINRGTPVMGTINNIYGGQ